MTPRPPTRFTIGGDEFRHTALSAVDEFHCVRRVAPLVKTTGALVTVLAGRSVGEDAEADRIAGVIEGAAPLLRAFADLSEADADYVIHRCMGATETREGEAWVPVWDHDSGGPALERLRMTHVLRISYEVLREAISVFFSDAASSLIELGLLARATAR